LWIFITLAILVTGCETTPNPTDLAASRSMMTADAVLGPAMDVLFDFPSLPTLGEESTLTFILKINKNTIAYNKLDTKQLSNCKARLDFFWTNTSGSYSEAKIYNPVPIDEVLVRGQPMWEGDALNGINLNCTIKIPREGIWRIQGTVFESNTTGKDKAIIGGEDWITVAEGVSTRGYGHRPEPALSSYLNNFLYGRFSDKVLEDSNEAIVLVLDMANAPLTGETVQVTCTIASLFDVAGFSMHSDFRKFEAQRFKAVSASNMLVAGKLEWKGDLKAREPAVVTATIRFPEAGEWEILVQGNSQSRELKNIISFFDSLKLNISDYRSSYTWWE
jgi:hypothetical protein